MLALRGELLVVGKQPDGDSIRFLPDTPALLSQLDHGDRVRRSSDGTLQLRVEGIDAPETHYNAVAQPRGDRSRDRLLTLCGFRNVRRGGHGEQAQTVTAATPERIHAAVLSHIVDVNGRAVSFLLVGANLPVDAADVPLDTDLLHRTLNARMLADGSAYLTLYASLDAPVRAVLRSIADSAKRRKQGVWSVDHTERFRLRDQASIGPSGQLILPKLFRRCTDYLRTRGAAESLADWLRTHGGPGRPEDDGLRVRGGRLRHLSDLVVQQGDHIGLHANLLDIVFEEK
jgi:endonuclease YncB( thermonuclease family)